MLEIDGEEWLFYKAFPITVALIRGTTADLDRQHHDGARGARARQPRARDGGQEFQRVRDRAGRAHRGARRAESAPGGRSRRIGGLRRGRAARRITSRPTAPPTAPRSRASCGFPLDMLAAMPLDERKIIARRCAFELPMGGVVNLGIGMPEGVAAVANEEKVLESRDADGRAGRHRRRAAERARLRRGGQYATP